MTTNVKEITFDSLMFYYINIISIRYRLILIHAFLNCKYQQNTDKWNKYFILIIS